MDIKNSSYKPAFPKAAQDRLRTAALWYHSQKLLLGYYSVSFLPSLPPPPFFIKNWAPPTVLILGEIGALYSAGAHD